MKLLTCALATLTLTLAVGAQTLPFQLTVPKGWTAHPERLSPGVVGGMWLGPGDSEYPPTIRVTVRQQPGTWEDLKKSNDESIAQQPGMTLVGRSEFTRDKHPFLSYHLKLALNGDKLEGYSLVFAEGSKTCFFTGLSREVDWTTNGPILEAAAASFRPSP